MRLPRARAGTRAVPRRDPRHPRARRPVVPRGAELHYTGPSLERLLRDTGFRVLERTPLPTMVYDDAPVWSERCRGRRAEGLLAPPEDLLRVPAVPADA